MMNTHTRIGHAIAPHTRPATWSNRRTITARALIASCIAMSIAWLAAPSAAQTEAGTDTQTDTSKQAAQDVLKNVEGLEDARVEITGSAATVTGTADDPAVVEKVEEIVRAATGATDVNNRVELSDDVGDRIRGATTRVEARLDRWIALMPLLPLAVAAVLLSLVVSWLAGRWRWPYDRFARNPFLSDILRRFVQVAIFGLGVLLALEILNATALVGGVLGAAGVAGIAIGFAFRDLVENYIASVLLSLRQPFRPKDHVVIDGHEGIVTSMTSRSTVITTFDGNLVRIPNATVFKTSIINYSADPRRRFSFAVGVGYDVDLAEAVRLGVQIVGETPGVMADPAPFAIVTTLGDSSITIEIFGWVDQSEHDFGKVRSVAVQRVKVSFDDRDIDMPEPIYKIRMDDSTRPIRPPRGVSLPNAHTSDIARDETAEQLAESHANDDEGADLLADKAGSTALPTSTAPPA